MGKRRIIKEEMFVANDMKKVGIEGVMRKQRCYALQRVCKSERCICVAKGV